MIHQDPTTGAVQVMVIYPSRSEPVCDGVPPKITITCFQTRPISAVQPQPSGRYPPGFHREALHAIAALTAGRSKRLRLPVSIVDNKWTPTGRLVYPPSRALKPRDPAISTTPDLFDNIYSPGPR